MTHSRFEVISPVDNQVFLTREFATDSQIEATLHKASEATSIWKKTPLNQRQELCSRAVDHIVSREKEIAREITLQMGRPIKYAGFEISKGFKERAQYMISATEEALREISIEDSTEAIRRIRKEPRGTVFCMAPWNYPFLTSVNVIIPAILAGNTVILKHALQTPLCAERYLEAFQSAGLPEGVFQILHLSHEKSAEVIRDPRVDYIAFTGSVNGGIAVKEAMGSRFIGSTFELGGKDAAYVRKDADLSFAVENLVDGSFFNSGQSCCGIERIYVDKEIYDPFVESFIELTKNYIVGNPLDGNTTLGPMVRTSAAQFVRGQINKAALQGATLNIQENHFPEFDEESPYLYPQVLTQVNHKMDIMKEETFGPVVGIMAVADDKEAVHWINDSQYGLTASIWSNNTEPCLALTHQLNVGTCYLNRCDYLDPALAWTGINHSGIGVSLSTLGFDSLTQPKSIHFKKL